MKNSYEQVTVELKRYRCEECDGIMEPEGGRYWTKFGDLKQYVYVCRDCKKRDSCSDPRGDVIQILNISSEVIATIECKNS
jgi:hypothetical protein